ncbi:TetR/AcrR family transcriptional regulator [Nonomuraea sp. KC401]|uniref:TetR/AcrR family transcriptional regulator n=1 Tax=unclassified Nonomuraea TaxID=2593643 RepID=UPI0010FE6DFC|nr:TetR/AcrR family transcriptional regulator [Nonomuraea sp. KC401]NBE95168.1 TetR family transcriptional regulator [Nonomuraea sp. K271]TLF73421.1 TetR/AcrR family transcriptional regulator [Nonomuraea sp. KC401]
MTSHDSAPRLRADARRNREQVITAARQVFVEQGADASLEEVARRAGVGIATLYRRFPDRGALIRAVVLDNMELVTEEFERANALEPDAWSAIVRLLRFIVRHHIGALVLLLLPGLHADQATRQQVAAARQRILGRLRPLVRAAQREGGLRTDITVTDLALGLVKLARPVPMLSAERNSSATERQLELFIDALRASSVEGSGLPGRPPARAELDGGLGLPL